MTDYKDTLNLPNTGFPMKANLAQREPEMLRRWESMGLYARVRAARIGAKPFILHVDFQRVQADEKIRLHVPIHFINEETCPGIKSGGQASHVMADVEITCLPKDLPEYIAVDMSKLEMGAILHASQLELPEGVELAASDTGEDPIVVTIHTTHRSETAEEEGTEEEGEGE